MDEFPKMIYKPDGDVEVDGKTVATLIVDDAEAATAAASDGWTDLAGALNPKAAKGK